MSTTLIVSILIGCVALIGAVYAVYKRGIVSGEKVQDHPAGSAKS